MFFATGAPSALKRIFESIGLSQIAEHRQFDTLVFKTDKDVLDAVLLGGPVALAVKRFSDQDWAEVCREFLSSIAEFKRSDGSYGIPGEFVTVTGIRSKI